jgi:hypothetical protein
MNGLNFFRKRWAAVAQCDRGLALIEFALSLTILILVFFGGVEVTRYVIIVQKLEKTADTIADVVAQYNQLNDPLTTADVTALFNDAQYLMYPYWVTSSATTIISDVSNTGTPQAPNILMNWQCVSSTTLGGGTGGYISKLGLPGGGSNNVNFGSLPWNPNSGSLVFTLNPGEEIIVSEAYYQYQPITGMMGMLNNLPPLYRTAVFVPRYGSLATAFTGADSPCPNIN